VFYDDLVRLTFFVLGVAFVACASPPSSAPASAVSLDVPPLPPPKPSAQPAARPPEPTPPVADDSEEAPRPRDPAAAEAAFQNARRAMDAGDYGRACKLFRDSLALDHATGTLLNLGLCEEKAGDRAGALRHYQAAEAEATKNGQRDRAAFAHARAAALMGGP
jgi:tetratricopeptide (TPR) repeat protein